MGTDPARPGYPGNSTEVGNMASVADGVVVVGEEGEEEATTSRFENEQTQMRAAAEIEMEDRL